MIRHPVVTYPSVAAADVSMQVAVDTGFWAVSPTTPLIVPVSKVYFNTPTSILTKKAPKNKSHDSSFKHLQKS